MTTFYFETIKCAICHESNEFTLTGSTNSFGSPDLDLRAPGMVRNTMHTWIQKCKRCGYCFSDISKAEDGQKNIIESNEYRKQLLNTEFPQLANDFLCSTIINENISKIKAAVWDAIHAAWVCDDHNKKNQAKYCRQLALALIDLMPENSTLTNNVDSDTLIKIDLHRRSKNFNKSLELTDNALNSNPEKDLIAILNYQKHLISLKDSSCHSINDKPDPIP